MRTRTTRFPSPGCGGRFAARTTDWLDPGTWTTSVEPASQEAPRMRHLWWGLIPFVAALVAIRSWWAELADIVGLVTLVCGLAYVVMRTRRPIPPLKAEPGPDKRDVQRDLPPPPG